MRLGVKITILVGVVLVAAGCIIGTLTLWRMNWTLEPPKPSESHSESFDADVSDISMQLKNWDVNVYRAEGDKIELSWWGTDVNRLEIDQTGDALKLSQEFSRTMRRNWVNWFWVDLGGLDYNQISLGIPDGFAGTLDIDAGTGDVTMSDLSLAQASIQVGSGGVWADNLTVKEGLKAETTTGSVTISGLSTGGNLQAGATTGDITISDAAISGDVRAENNTGNAYIHNCSAKSIGVTSTTGDINVSGLDFQEGISLECTTGGVSGTLPGGIGDYDISSSTSTGNNSLPQSLSGGSRYLNVSTTTGDISLNFEN